MFLSLLVGSARASSVIQLVNDGRIEFNNRDVILEATGTTLNVSGDVVASGLSLLQELDALRAENRALQTVATALNASLLTERTARAQLESSFDAKLANLTLMAASISELEAKFSFTTQKECGHIYTFAGACRGEVGDTSTYLAAVGNGETGKEACVRAFCGRKTGGSCSGTSSSGAPFCKDSVEYNNDIGVCGYNPSCQFGWKDGGHRYNNECDTAYGSLGGYACCKQTSNSGPGPLSGIVADNARRTGGAFTDVLARCPLLDNGCAGTACVFY